MTNPTNKTLFALTTVLVALTLFMQYWVLSQPGIQITGAPTTDTGTVTFSLTSEGSVRFAVATINFGTGKVNTSAGNTICVLDTNGTNNSNQCINFTAVNGNLTLENDGSQNATIQLSVDKNAASFLGGTGPLFRYNIAFNETQSCRNGTGGVGTVDWPTCIVADGTSGNCTVAPMNWTDVNATSPGTTICQRLLFTDINDSIALEINITLPYDTPSGTKTATFTATATSTT